MPAGSLVEFVPGTSPVVITVPHGGYERPETIADRTVGCMEHDYMSQELARCICDRLAGEMPSGKPHLIITHLNRVKCDVNRSLESCCDGDPGAQAVYSEYHSSVRQAIEAAVRAHGFCHLFDIHGQSHRDALELGYLLSTSDLQQSDESIDADGAQLAKCSVQGLWKREPCCGSTLSAVVRGQDSLGSLLERAGVRTMPSSAQPHPTFASKCETYFWGAFTTVCYGRALADAAVTVTGHD